MPEYGSMTAAIKTIPKPPAHIPIWPQTMTIKMPYQVVSPVEVPLLSTLSIQLQLITLQLIAITIYASHNGPG